MTLTNDRATSLVGRFTTTRFLRFAVIGGSGVVVNLIVIHILFAQLHWTPVIASALAVEAAILSNFVGNNWWTFEQRTFSFFRLAKYNLVALGGLLITTVIFTVLMQRFGLSYIIADLIGIGAATAWNFAASVLWAWGS
ncbi:MAG TPA: GtrA family protein [Chloroflexota bacterium]|nr:GtrA family protein [Chloroflexota bacterium]